MASETVQIQSLTDLAERLFAKPPALQVSQGDINRWRVGGDHVVCFSSRRWSPTGREGKALFFIFTVCLSRRMCRESQWWTI